MKCPTCGLPLRRFYTKGEGTVWGCDNGHTYVSRHSAQNVQNARRRALERYRAGETTGEGRYRKDHPWRATWH